MRWDPNLYSKYLDERSRPAHDLIRAISHHSPAEAVDLGCGSGHLTALSADMWPMARVTGIDNSHAMLEQARTRTASVDWIEADIGVWPPTAPPLPAVAGKTFLTDEPVEDIVDFDDDALTRFGWEPVNVPDELNSTFSETIVATWNCANLYFRVAFLESDRVDMGAYARAYHFQLSPITPASDE
jgi:trans-aconitate 2-methyltransferase